MRWEKSLSEIIQASSKANKASRLTHNSPFRSVVLLCAGVGRLEVVLSKLQQETVLVLVSVGRVRVLGDWR